MTPAPRPKRRVVRLLLVVSALAGGFVTLVVVALVVAGAWLSALSSDGASPTRVETAVTPPPVDSAPQAAIAPPDGGSDESAFEVHIRETVAEAEQRCKVGRLAHECADGVCAIRWHAPADVQRFERLREGSRWFIDMPVLVWSVARKWAPCAETQMKLTGQPEHWKLGGMDCMIVADPEGPSLDDLDEAVVSAAEARCRRLEVPAP